MSCIPKGSYTVQRDHTGRQQWYQLQHVPGRSFIEFHPANWVRQLNGCIAVGTNYNWEDNHLVESVTACKQLVSEFGESPWLLTIDDYNGNDPLPYPA